MIERHFAESAPLSLGVEEEVMILDAETFEPVGAVDVLVRGAEHLELPGMLKTELHASVVELATDICADVDEAIAALRELRAAADRIAREHGLVIAAAGAHPTAALSLLPVVQEERYLEMIQRLGYVAQRQGVNGLHVHVGVESREHCYERLEAVLPWLPVVLAGLSVAGIFMGILLRVRAFLFLGTGFLVLAMLTIVWHAAVDLQHTWLIWLTVVIAGVLVLGVFAVFEKKRQEVLRVVDQLRQWSP